MTSLFYSPRSWKKKQRAEKRARKTRPDPSEVLGNLCNPSSRSALEQIPELSSSTAGCSGFCPSGRRNYGQGKHAKAIIQIWLLPQRSGLSSVRVFLSLVAGVFYLSQFPPLLFLLIMHQTSLSSAKRKHPKAARASLFLLGLRYPHRSVSGLALSIFRLPLVALINGIGSAVCA